MGLEASTGGIAKRLPLGPTLAVNAEPDREAGRSIVTLHPGITMSLLGPASPRQLSVGIALVRIITGIVFAAHGYQKFFIYGLDGATGAFTQMGIPAPTITAPLVAIVELAGGIALIIGLLTRLAALGLAINMLGAIFLVRLKGGFFAPNGAEYEIVLCAACLALVVAGAGAFSADEAIARRRSPAVGDAYGRTP